MTPEERELRRALDARSGTPSPDFLTRVSALVAAPHAPSRLMPAVAVLAALAITVGAVGVLVLARNAQRVNHGGPASASRTSSPSPFYPATVDLSAPTDSVLWDLVDGSFLYRSLDGGRTWEQRPLPERAIATFVPSRYTYISFLDDHEGWIVNDGPGATQCSLGAAAIWHTTNAGSSWQQLIQADVQATSGTRTASGGIGDEQCKDVVSFVDAKHGFLDAWDDNSPPTIYRTSDGGRTWAGSRLPDPPGFKTYGSGDALRAGRVRGLGGILLLTAYGMQPNGYHNYVFRSTDGGASWKYLATTPSPVAIVTTTRWLTVQPVLAEETLDGGRTWHAYATDYTQAAGVPPEILFTDSSVGYATVRGEIQRTTDGGAHWRAITIPGA